MTFRLVCILLSCSSVVHSLVVPASTSATRRDWLTTTAAASFLPPSTLVGTLLVSSPPPAIAAEESIFAPKFVQEYPDFIRSPTGWSYRDVNPGSDQSASSYASQVGDRVVFAYSGFTIGYFARPFQAMGGPQGGAFDKDIDYSRTVLGSGKFIAGLEQALTGMTVGGVRQVLIPYGDLSYPPSDPNHDVVGPKPQTFSGMRALNFVLENPRLDRTLLFNVKVIRIDRPDGKGGFKRG